MFNRFSERARRAIIYAKDEAKRLNHDCIDAGDLLVGVISKEETGAVTLLRQLGVKPEGVRKVIYDLLPPSKFGELNGDVPFTACAKRALELSAAAARGLGHNYIGTEHLLLGLFEEGNGRAYIALSSMGLDAGKLRIGVKGVFRQGGAGENRPEGQSSSPGSDNKSRRFSGHARKAMTLAMQEAKRLNHGEIGTEHLLLGLIREGEGVATVVLHRMSDDLGAIRTAVEILALSPSQKQVTGHIPFTPGFMKAMDLAFQEALALGHDYVGTEHILLGLVKEGEGIGCRVLLNLGFDYSRLLAQVRDVLASGMSDGSK